MTERTFEKFWSELKTQRDELKLKAHLAKAELKEEWEALEQKWPQIESKLNQIETEVEQSASEIKGSLEIVGEELSNAYKRMKERLDDSKDH